MKKLIVCAGIHHSGSTWIYNILRYAFMNAEKKVHADQYGKGAFDLKCNAEVYIAKTHLFWPELAEKADIVITSIRDIRDIIASAIRREEILGSATAVSAETQRIIALEYEPWKAYSNYEMRYEEMIADRVGMALKILTLLDLPLEYAETICEDVRKLGYHVLSRADVSTQLWPNHCGKGLPGNYREGLSVRGIEAVEAVAGNWLKEKGYL
jgi:hypothetical protein